MHHASASSFAEFQTCFVQRQTVLIMKEGKLQVVRKGDETHRIWIKTWVGLRKHCNRYTTRWKSTIYLLKDQSSETDQEDQSMYCLNLLHDSHDSISHTWTVECLGSGVTLSRINVNILDISGQHSLFILVRIFPSSRATCLRRSRLPEDVLWSLTSCVFHIQPFLPSTAPKVLRILLEATLADEPLQRIWACIIIM